MIGGRIDQACEDGGIVLSDNNDASKILRVKMLRCDQGLNKFDVKRMGHLMGRGEQGSASESLIIRKKGNE